MTFDFPRRRILARNIIAGLCLLGAGKVCFAEDAASKETKLPQDQIKKIIEAKGEVKDGVLDIGLPRKISAKCRDQAG